MKKIFYSFTVLSLMFVGFMPLVKAIEVGDTIDLPVTIRDFHGIGWGTPGIDTFNEHPDFEDGIVTDSGIVLSTLGVDKKPVYAGLSGNPSTHGQTAFDQWYRDTANINMHTAKNLTFTWDGSKYVYNNSNFFPIDDELLGNDSRSHNYHFTLEMHSQFTYKGGETFSFTGDDDLWLFINGQLVIDIGGVHSALSASVDLDTLGLTADQNYDFDLFFAERHTTQSNFKAETTIALEEKKATVIAQKIVCKNESDLKNWSGTSTDITASTAQDFVNASDGACEFVSDWQFQWGDHQIDPKLLGDLVGTTDESGWHLFDSATGPAGQPAQVDINLSDLTTNNLWFREVLQSGYIPFSYPSTEYPTAPGGDVSAEFWCSSDVLNYDNSEYINVTEDNTYYCVAMNVLEQEPTDDIHGYKWNDEDGNGLRGQEELLAGWTIFIDANKNGVLDDGETSTSTSNVEGEDYGWYWFENLPYDDYSICEVQQGGWTQTYPASCHSVTLPDEGFEQTRNSVLATEHNFGNHQDSVCTVNCGGGGGPISTISSGGGSNTSQPTIDIEKTGEALVVPGLTASHSLTITNTGSVLATNVVVTDILPAGFTFTDNSLATHTWDLGTMTAGEVKTVSYTINIPVNASGSYTNLSKVSINGALVAPQYDEDSFGFTVAVVQVLGFETEAPAEVPPAEVKVLGYEQLPQTGGPVATNFTWLGALLLMSGAFVIRKSRISL